MFITSFILLFLLLLLCFLARFMKAVVTQYYERNTDMKANRYDRNTDMKETDMKEAQI